jgi:hypothetical protein
MANQAKDFITAALTFQRDIIGSAFFLGTYVSVFNPLRIFIGSVSLRVGLFHRFLIRT